MGNANRLLNIFFIVNRPQSQMASHDMAVVILPRISIEIHRHCHMKYGPQCGPDKGKLWLPTVRYVKSNFVCLKVFRQASFQS